MSTAAEIAQTWAGVIFDLASPAIAGLVVAWLRKRHVNNTVIAALGRAAGMVILDLRRADRPTTFAAALTRGAGYMVERVPGYLRKAGITPAATVDMVYAEVGRQLGPEAAKLLPARAPAEPASSGVSETKADSGSSIFPEFKVNVPMPSDTAAPGSHA